jgi:hypothetical protein
VAAGEETRASGRPLVLRLAYAFPVFGWMLREAAEGPAVAKTLFVVNCLLIWILAIAIFGYPAIILPALAMVPVIFTVLILITKG